MTELIVRFHHQFNFVKRSRTNSVLLKWGTIEGDVFTPYPLVPFDFMICWTSWLPPCHERILLLALSKKKCRLVFVYPFPSMKRNEVYIHFFGKGE